MLWSHGYRWQTFSCPAGSGSRWYEGPCCDSCNHSAYGVSDKMAVTSCALEGTSQQVASKAGIFSKALLSVELSLAGKCVRNRVSFHCERRHRKDGNLVIGPNKLSHILLCSECSTFYFLFVRSVKVESFEHTGQYPLHRLSVKSGSLSGRKWGLGFLPVC